MEILWLAIVFYSVGLAGILYFRPGIMFNEDGTWKEFGYQRNTRHTIFPFWLFAITWAFVSYALAAAFSWVSVETAAVTTAAVSTYYSGEEYDDEEDTDLTPVSEVIRRRPGRPKGSTSKKSSTTQPRPGYYMLDPESRESGLSRYIYYGEQPPTETDALGSETE